ncbi:hypothetical protein PPS11_00877 [Pseudomonas putida S11]|nr:hypothetical protein PPS11_00877 [Pseudomonas putida S11]
MFLQASFSQYFFNLLLDQLIQPIYRLHKSFEGGFQKAFVRPALSHCSTSSHQGGSASQEALKLAVDSRRRAPRAKIIAF